MATMTAPSSLHRHEGLKTSTFFDYPAIKDAGRGNWRTIATQVIGIPEDYLTGQNGPCPKCQDGTDRWKVFKDFDETGGAMCNQCGRMADGIALAHWFMGISPVEADERLAIFLGVSPGRHKSSSKPKSTLSPRSTVTVKTGAVEPFDSKARRLEFRPWNDRLSSVLTTKKNFTEEAIKLAGGQFAKYYGTMCIAIPITGRDGKTHVGYVLFNATGGTMPDPNSTKPLKVRTIKLKEESGWMGRFLPGKETFKVEGVSDMLTLLSIDPSASVVSNTAGAVENPLSYPRKWMLEQLRGETVYTIHDCDKPGQEGALWVPTSNGTGTRPGWATAAAIVAKESRNVVLPYEITESHGKDLRDWVSDQIDKELTNEQIRTNLYELARASAVVERPEGYELESQSELGPDSAENDEGDSQEGISDSTSPPADINELYKKHGVEPAISNAELRRCNAIDTYIVDGVLVKNQPAIIAGPSKTMKTTIAIDLAISIATQHPFLFRYEVKTQERVLVLSAESGLATIKKTEARIAIAKGVYDAIDNDLISWQKWVPYINDSEQLSILRYEIEKTKCTVVVLDPLYQMLDGVAANNYSLNGQQLRTICDLCLSCGATPIIVDHAKKSSTNVKEYSPLELEDISGAGKAEYFRQWILIARRRQYVAGDPHDLWLTVGGSAGHASSLGVSIDERENEYGNRDYTVTVESSRETRDSMQDAKANRIREKKDAEKKRLKEERREKILLAFVGKCRLTKSQIASIAGLNPANTTQAIADLIRSNELETIEEKINGVMRDVFYRP